MSVLILHKLKEGEPYFKWLEDIEDVYLFTTENVQFDTTVYSYTKEYENYTINEQLVNDAIKLGKKKNIKHVLSFYEDDIIRAAKIREAIGIEGQHYKSAVAYRNKLVMKDYIRNAGLNCPEYQEIISSRDVLDFVSKHEYPVVVKPIDGMGSQNTYTITNEIELGEFLSNHLDSNMMIERYQSGQMYSSNGLVVDNKIVFCSINRYSSGGLFYKQDSGFLAELIDPSNTIFEKIKSFTEKIISSLPSPNIMVFHCEVFVDQKEIVFCEIASRPGGGAICEMIDFSYGINLNELAAKMLCGIDVKIPDEKPRLLSAYYKIPKKEGTLVASVDSIPYDWVSLFSSKVTELKEFDTPTSCADVLGTVVFTASNEAELKSRFHILSNYLKENIIWKL